MKTISKKKFKTMTVKYVGIAGLKKELAAFEKNMVCPPRHFSKKLKEVNWTNVMISSIGWDWLISIKTSKKGDLNEI